MNKRMRFAQVFTLVIFIFSSYSQTNVQGFPKVSKAFDFTLLDGTVVNLSDYQDKPILLDWSASWCTLCKENQKIIDSIYSDFQDKYNIITLSYGGSGDDLTSVKKMKDRGNYPWTYGLDHDNYAKIAEAANADVWLLDLNLNLKYSWDYTIVSRGELVNSMNELLLNLNVSTADITVEEEVNLIGLDENPFFVGFLIFAVIAIIFVIYSKIKK